MDLGVKGKNYILVGGTKGMGWEAARVLAADGANLALVSRTGELAEERAKSLVAEHGIRAVGYGADGTARGEIETAVQRAIRELGPIRGLLTTPGSTAHNNLAGEMTDDEWESNFQDVMMSQVRSCRAIIPHLLEQGGGHIVTTSAYSAHAAKGFITGYAALKAGLVNFTKNIAKTYGAQGIRANCVCPGAVETWGPARRQQFADEYGKPFDEALEYVLVNVWKMPVAMQRLGRPEECGDVMAFLLSERAAYMTGATINVDGGTDF